LKTQIRLVQFAPKFSSEFRQVQRDILASVLHEYAPHGFFFRRLEVNLGHSHIRLKQFRKQLTPPICSIKNSAEAKIISGNPTTMKTQLKIFSILTVGALLLTGCQTEQVSPPQMTQIQCAIPQISVIQDKVNTETQSKGGLDITIVPALYKAVRADKTTVTQVQASIGEQLSLVGQNLQNKVYVEQDTTPQLKAEPSRLVFTVKIHNQLNRVFHGQGAVVQFNVDGTLIPFNNTDYKEFSGGIVPPLNDGDLVIKGPPLDTLKDKGTISIFLYDVVTATDVAGNTTEKQNYTWDFSYTMQASTDTAAVQKTRGLMDIGQYQQIILQQQMQLQRQTQENQMQQQ
jgi:hypothetical protein